MIKKLTIFFLFIITACAENINKFKDSDFESTENYEQRITTILKISARDSDSLQIKKISKPKKTLIQNTKPSALWNPYFPAQGFCVEFYKNNSYGIKVFNKKNFYLYKNQFYIDAITQNQYQPCNQL